MHGLKSKGTKEEKYWTKLIQDNRELVKSFNILASTESLFLTLNYFLALFGASMVCNLYILET